MASKLRLDKVLSSDGISGIDFSATNKKINITIDDWIIENDGGVLTPTNKTKVYYGSTGGDQSFIVPAGVTYIFAKLWGAGGGAGRASGWSYGADGGGGGYSRGLIPVTPGETLTIKVGYGGRTAVFGSSYGGGGGALNTTDTTYGGQGGGGCYIFRSTTPLLIAGGGGGGGCSRAWIGNIGGAGGGLVGQKGESPYDLKVSHGGTGGTQSAGGTATGGGSGSQYQGGTPGTNSYGGGGGGGYFGGGGGGYSETNTMAGGGGGSGYVATSVLLGATFTGAHRAPAFFWDNDLLKEGSNSSSYGWGGQNVQNNFGANTVSGGNALCAIYY